MYRTKAQIQKTKIFPSTGKASWPIRIFTSPVLCLQGSHRSLWGMGDLVSTGPCHSLTSQSFYLGCFQPVRCYAANSKNNLWYWEWSDKVWGEEKDGGLWRILESWWAGCASVWWCTAEQASPSVSEHDCSSSWGGENPSLVWYTTERLLSLLGWTWNLKSQQTQHRSCREKQRAVRGSRRWEQNCGFGLLWQKHKASC